MKKFSGEFVFACAMLLMSFVVFEIVVLPNMYRTDETAAVAFTQKAKDVYRMQPSANYPGAFTFDYAFTRTKSFGKGQTAFDMPIAPFDERSAPGITHVGSLRDTWGYPVRENAFMKSGKGSMKSDRSDEDPDVVGLVNCRADESVTGYFKAYFEDVALGNGVDYDDPTYGEGRRTEACQVLEDVAGLIKLDETDVTPDILFMADTGDMPSGALAAASAYFGSTVLGPDDGTLHRHIIAHEDPTPEQGEFDAFVMTNFNGVAWDVDSELNPSTYDFYTVIYHEVLHALGFRGLLPAVIGTTGDQHHHGTFDAFTYRDGTLTDEFFDPVTMSLQVPTGAPSPWFITNDVVYRGIPNIANAEPDGTRPVYSPENWQEGSSLSHFDMNRSGGQAYVMHPSIGTNTERSIHEHEKEVLCHLGYQVEGMTGCEAPTPAAEDDAVVLQNSNICITPLTNDQAFDSGFVSIQSIDIVAAESDDHFYYYPNDICSGPSSSDPTGKRSIRLSPGMEHTPKVLSYTVRNSIAQRISPAATITISQSCGQNVDDAEYVCNGDFEDPLVQELYAFAFSCGGGGSWLPAHIVPYWCAAIQSPDLASYSAFGPWPELILPFYCENYFSGCLLTTPSGAGNAMRTISTIVDGAISLEAGLTRLKAPLVVGETYQISFDARVLNYEAGLFAVVAQVSVEQPTTSLTAYLLNDLPTPDQELVHQDVPGDSNDWTHIEQTFVASAPLEYLTVYGSNPTATAHYYFDNISIHTVEEPSPNSVQGTVYEDENQNGSLDQAEPGLAGIEIGIFHPGETVPFETTITEDIPHLGEYSFAGIADGAYRLALIDESVFGEITQPAVNTLIPGYAHAAVSVVTDGEVSAGNDFGVTLPPAALANIHLKKSLVDATLSIVDRNITWRVEAVNGGPHAANNIHILDLTPAPLIYYAHVAEFPDTYSQNSGMWYIPHLEPGESAIIQITMKVPWGTCGTRTNTATLQSLDEIDTDPTDNTAMALIKLRACGNTIESVK